MKKAVIEILYEGEKVLGSRTIGEYMVRYYDEDDDEISGSFHKTMAEAEASAREYQEEEEDDD